MCPRDVDYQDLQIQEMKFDVTEMKSSITKFKSELTDLCEHSKSAKGEIVRLQEKFDLEVKSEIKNVKSKLEEVDKCLNEKLDALVEKIGYLIKHMDE